MLSETIQINAARNTKLDQIPVRTTVDVVIEWENAKLSELERARDMLKQLALQSGAPEISERFDISTTIFFDHEEIDRSLIENVVDQVKADTRGDFSATITPCGHLNYYQQKNAGAERSNSDIVVFLDSDVIPDALWLERLLESVSEFRI